MNPARREGVVNALTVDVEDYYQVSAFEGRIPRAEWERWPSRVEPNTRRILELLAAAGVHATFFVLGWVAQRHPELVRAIHAAGHEVASHGWEHLRAHRQAPREFREDVVRTKGILEGLTGCAVSGYRAASYSIGATNLWALVELREAGYRYSSSIYPVVHDHYGMPDAPRGPHRHLEQGVIDLPIATCELLGRRWPIGGGGFFRLYPYWLSRRLWQRLNRLEGVPGVFYFHPWELDPDQPRVAGLPLKSRIRHYLNLERMPGRIEHWVREFTWDRMDRVYDKLIESDS